jgi:hypothetical protein
MVSFWGGGGRGVDECIKLLNENYPKLFLPRSTTSTVGYNFGGNKFIGNRVDGNDTYLKSK